ncbi:flagellar export chaperone FliS [Litoribrevibacter albus]|uniref:Flagellar secretion chaperone FliS n=1 Tax=Litoribrevibacter albus TaxID=1473156 RepID=A0AA37SD59_9GAMM|nr:flagellar export chaperone FliS [Litoribrevibacter albus]GLQ32238.1 B-type flagellar protein FliS [Litoribrevibacter albus]
MMANPKLQQYSKVNAQTGIVDADPHRLIQLLYHGLLENLAKAKGMIDRKDIEGKNKHIVKACDILNALRTCLDPKHNKELVDSLDSLYDYCIRQLLMANLKNDNAIIDEVVGLILPVKTAWDEIRDQVVQQEKQPTYNGTSATA